jgi:hypothetical protein
MRGLIWSQIKALVVLLVLIGLAGLIGIVIPPLENSSFIVFIVLWLGVVVFGAVSCWRAGYWRFGEPW